MEYNCIRVLGAVFLIILQVNADQRFNSSLKIFSGSTAVKGVYRYTVWLRRNGVPSCGGTLLTKDWVLTAASCLTNIIRKNKIKIFIGDYNRNTRKTEFRVKPAEIILHPGFDEITLENNIGLLKLPKSAPIRRKNIALLPGLVKPEQDGGFQNNTQCYMTGWGQQQDGQDNSRLQVLNVQVLSSTQCDNLDEEAKELCYTGTPGGACATDEGSPVICMINGVETQVGIHSKTKCTSANTAMTRVSAFYSWIDSYVNIEPVVLNDCGPLPEISNGIFINTGSDVGDTATLLCNSNYRPTDGATCIPQITCQESGEWSSTSVRCVEVCESSGTSFMFGFLRNAFGEGTPYLYISASEVTQVQIQVPVLDVTTTFNVTQLAAVEFPSSIDDLVNEEISNSGVWVTSDKPISVYIHNYRPGDGPSADGSMIYPESCLGNRYRVIAHDASPDAALSSEFMVVGLNVGTNVNILLTDGTIIQVNLDRFAIYFLRGTDVTGASVVADKPVAILAGHECASVPDEEVEKCDHLVEMLPPTTSLSTQYIVTNFNPRPNYSVRIVADTDDTIVVTFDEEGNEIETFNLDEGEFVFKTFSQNRTIAMISNLPILVAQYGHGATSDDLSFGDPSMVIIPGLDQFINRYVINTPQPPDLYNRHWVYIVVSDCYGYDGLLVGGESLFTGESAPPFITVQGLGRFYIVHLEVTELNLIITHSDSKATFGVVQYGFNELVEYAWIAGRSFTAV